MRERERRLKSKHTNRNLTDEEKETDRQTEREMSEPRILLPRLP